MDIKHRTTSAGPDDTEPVGGVENVDPIALDNANTLVIVEFSGTCPQETKDWLEELISSPRGAGLKVKGVLDEDSKKTFHLSATEKKFLSGAEQLNIKKLDKNNTLKEVTKDNWREFEVNENSSGPVLNSADKQQVILQALNSIKAEKELNIPGYPDRSLYTDQAIIPLMQAFGIISQVFPLHNKIELSSLKNKWYKSLSWRQPLDDIKNYYGSTIAIYFAFLEYYTFALVIPVLLALCFFFIKTDETWKNLIFAFVNVLLGTVFLELWKRNCVTICHRWGTLKSSSLGEVKKQVETPRPLYHGEIRISPITGKNEIHFPESQRLLKICTVSIPVVLLFIFIAISVMSGYIYIQDIMTETYGKESGIKATFMTMFPSITYSILIAILNNLYLRTATKLNDWENHKLESSYQNHLVVKLIGFYFVNNFYSLFHIAFVLQDMDLLKSHLAALVITQQLIGQVVEQLLPYVFYKMRVTKVSKDGKSIGIRSVRMDNDIEYQTKQEPYWGVFWDYLELFLQFGYVFLFSSVYPMAAFWALFNNICELRTDAFKVSKMCQRVFAEHSDSIGAWQAAFEIMGILSVITNCALVATSPVVKEWLPSDFSPINTVLLFVAVEHIILAIKFIMAMVIPDVPGWIVEELERKEYLKEHAMANLGEDAKLKTLET